MMLTEYRGKMGRLTDAGALLKAIESGGRQMRLPNIYMAPDTSKQLDLSEFLTSSAVEATTQNREIAEVTLYDNMLTIEAKGAGQTSLSVKCDDGTTHHATITVRKGANDNGWL